jgi:hypothetical protein
MIFACEIHPGISSWAFEKGSFMSAEIKPYRISIGDEVLHDLKHGCATRAGGSRTGRGLECRYWAEEYDWRGREGRLNRFAQFTTEIDGLDIHFLHVRSKHPEAMPLVITHGWPGSVVEFHKVIEPLTDPTARRQRLRCVSRRLSLAAGLWLLREAEDNRLGRRPHRVKLGGVDGSPRISGARRRLGIDHHHRDRGARFCALWPASTGENEG